MQVLPPFAISYNRFGKIFTCEQVQVKGSAEEQCHTPTASTFITIFYYAYILYIKYIITI